jgi:hypothetical protein
MTLRTRILAFVIVAAVSSGAFAVAIAAHTRGNAVRPSQSDMHFLTGDKWVYYVRIANNDPSSGKTEWVAPALGAYRYQDKDFVFIFDGVRQQTLDKKYGSTTVTSGAAVVSQLRAASAGLVPLQLASAFRRPASTSISIRRGVSKNGHMQLEVFDRTGKRIYGIEILRRISLRSAKARHLFAIAKRPNNFQRDIRPTAATTLPIQAYWFGQGTSGYMAQTAAEVQRLRTPAQIAAGSPPQADQLVYLVIYQDAKQRDMQVSSTPVDSAYASHFIAALNGTNGDGTYPAWPRSTVHLAGGETADVVPHQFDGTGDTRNGFSVITNTTLINVSGEFSLAQINGLAERLQRH